MTTLDWKYLRSIQRSGKFERAYYRAMYGAGSWLARLFPLYHFVKTGEDHGCRPFPDFCPDDYLGSHPDVQTAGFRPFDHFLRFGENEGRALDGQLRDRGGARLRSSIYDNSCQVAAPANPASVAVVVHIYHAELWSEIAERLEVIPVPFDLYCSVVDRPQNKEVKQALEEQFPTASIQVVPNHGRDIMPFLWLLKNRVLDSYDAICKLHTKKSPHVKRGDLWRQHLVSSVLPDREGTAKILEAFRSNTAIGVVTGDQQRIQGIEWWDCNRYRIEELLNRISVEVNPREITFAAGSMYWVKPAALRLVDKLGLTPFDFESETGQDDGTLAHVMERAIGVLVETAGYTIQEVGELVGVEPSLSSREDLRFFCPGDPASSVAEIPMAPRITEGAIFRSTRRLRYEFTLDEISVRGVLGWVLDSRSGRRVPLRLYVDGSFVESRLADDYREDLATAGIDNGRFGFSLPIPEDCFDGETHHFRFLVGRGSSDGLFVNVHQRLPHAPEVGAARREPGGEISGWCSNPGNPERPPTIELAVHGYTMKVVPAQRQGETGSEIFNFRIFGEDRISEVDREGVRVRIAGSRLPLKLSFEE